MIKEKLIRVLTPVPLAQQLLQLICFCRTQLLPKLDGCLHSQKKCYSMKAVVVSSRTVNQRQQHTCMVPDQQCCAKLITGPCLQALTCLTPNLFLCALSSAWSETGSCATFTNIITSCHRCDDGRKQHTARCSYWTACCALVQQYRPCPPLKTFL